MESKEYISLEIFCGQYGTDITFMHSLQEMGLIEVITRDEQQCVDCDQLSEIERLLRLHRDLQINPEGLEVIMRLLAQMKEMEREILLLKSRLNIYEDE